MKPVIREYLASLRERGELDAMLPELISELGYTVFSRPSRGTRQFGVDVAAVGPGSDDRIYLFSIKRGDLTRSEWNGNSDQALRPSLDEILDAYIPNHLPPEHREKNIVICPCFGGEVSEAAHETFNTYMRTKTTDKITFAVWNGDRIAGLLEDGLLREGLLSPSMRSSLRKAIALSDEADASFAHFSRLVRALTDEAISGPLSKRLTVARQITISLWMLFSWSREQGNLESSYRASEYAILKLWEFGNEVLSSGNRSAEDMGLVLVTLVDLHFQIWDEIIGKKILPHSSGIYAISAAIHTASPLDINLKLFDIMGRLALHGLWRVWGDGRSRDLSALFDGCSTDLRIQNLANHLVELVVNNPALLTPVTDAQVIDLSLGFLFLTASGGRKQQLQLWIGEIAQRSDFAYRFGGRFPCTLRSYRELAHHPRADDDGYLKKVTAGSVLLPVLSLWAASLGDTKTLETVASLKKDILEHCTAQLWLPDEDSEVGLCRGGNDHGAALLDIPLTGDGPGLLDHVRRECVPETPFFELSAIKADFWPLVLLACRHHRLPVPPHFFFQAFQTMKQN
jgi:hypothetical protein